MLRPQRNVFGLLRDDAQVCLRRTDHDGVRIVAIPQPEEVHRREGEEASEERER